MINKVYSFFKKDYEKETDYLFFLINQENSLLKIMKQLNFMFYYFFKDENEDQIKIDLLFKNAINKIGENNNKTIIEILNTEFHYEQESQRFDLNLNNAIFNYLYEGKYSNEIKYFFMKNDIVGMLDKKYIDISNYEFKIIDMVCNIYIDNKIKESWIEKYIKNVFGHCYGDFKRQEKIVSINNALRKNKLNNLLIKENNEFNQEILITFDWLASNMLFYDELKYREILKHISNEFNMFLDKHPLKLVKNLDVGSFVFEIQNIDDCMTILNIKKWLEEDVKPILKNITLEMNDDEIINWIKRGKLFNKLDNLSLDNKINNKINKI